MAVTVDQRASRKNPCPVCGGTTKCLRYLPNTDAALCCNPPEHLKIPSREHVSSQFGMVFWFVPYSAIGIGAQPKHESNEPTSKPWDGFKLAYKDLHDRLDLSEAWLSYLLDRGFTPDQITNKEYRSIPADPSVIVEKLYRIYDDYWSEIPGFVRTASNAPTILGRGCLLIPIRDHSGEIQAFQIRSPHGTEPKYRWFSHGGLLGTPFHHVKGTSRSLVLTEGPLKADYLSTLTNYKILSWQGVNSLSGLAEELRKYNDVSEALIANDMDGWIDIAKGLGGKEIAKAIAISCGTLRAIQAIRKSTNWPVYVLRWPVRISEGGIVPKGIDDWAISSRKGLQKVLPTHFWASAEGYHDQLLKVLQ